MAIEKHFTVKIYDSLGTTIKTTVKPNEIKNTPQFQTKINAGIGQCVLDLDFEYNDFDEGGNIAHNNIVEIYVADVNNPNGRLLYKGFIYKYEPYIQATTEGVKIYLLGLVSFLTWDYYKSGASYTVIHAADDPATILKAIIDHFNTQVPHSLIGYDGAGTTIDNVGVTMNVEFQDKKWLDAINDTYKITDQSWWWAIDASGQVYLKNKPASATHTFTVGKDVELAIVGKDSIDIVNSVQVRYSGTDDVSDATSITDYGKRHALITDNQIQDSPTATQRGQKEVDDRKDPKIKAQLTINSNYDIESVKVGDTCKVRNIKGSGQLFDDNMQIVGIGYSWDKIVLELEDFNNDLVTELKKFVQNN